MIDFNDTAVPTGNQPRIVSDAEREELRAELLARLESVLFTLFPAGKKRRGKFLIGDVLGSPGDSLEVVLEGEKAGLWTDRADNSGGDVYALIGNHFGIRQGERAVIITAASTAGAARRAICTAAKNEEQVRSDAGNGTGDGSLCAVPHRKHGNHCRHADDNAKHGEA